MEFCTFCNAGTDYLRNQSNCAFKCPVTYIKAFLGHMIVQDACLTVWKKTAMKLCVHFPSLNWKISS